MVSFPHSAIIITTRQTRFQSRRSPLIGFHNLPAGKETLQTTCGFIPLRRHSQGLAFKDLHRCDRFRHPESLLLRRYPLYMVSFLVSIDTPACLTVEDYPFPRYHQNSAPRFLAKTGFHLKLEPTLELYSRLDASSLACSVSPKKHDDTSLGLIHLQGLTLIALVSLPVSRFRPSYGSSAISLNSQ